MKKDLSRWWLFVVTITAFLISLVGSLGAAYAEPLLVMQPAYVGMTFYVHQPQGIPMNWFTTYDGYPVWKGTDGVWFYGSYSNKGVVQTNYVVGSVVPSLVGISPYVIQTSAPAMCPSSHAVYPAPAMVTAVASVGCVSKWVNDPHFMALGTWRGNVDRVGILAKPSIPVAWKGKSPQVLYAWTGSRWYQLTAHDGERPGDVLKKNLYTLTRLVHQNGNYYWQAPDVAFLVSLLPQWGYIWMGEIGPNPAWIY